MVFKLKPKTVFMANELTVKMYKIMMKTNKKSLKSNSYINKTN